jgi:hypothetical protein
VPWLIEEIGRRNDDADADAIESLLGRVVDPREYDEGIAAAPAFVEPMNVLLAADGFEVGHQRGRPFVRRLHDAADPATLDQVAATLASPALRSAVRELVSDPGMADILIGRLDEVDASRRAGAHLLTVIGTGSFIEGLLHDVLMMRDPVTRKEKQKTLDFLLRRAHERGWIQADAFQFGSLVRQYRNLVHPREQLTRRVTPDADTVLTCWHPVLALINDLRALLPGRP